MVAMHLRSSVSPYMPDIPIAPSAIGKTEGPFEPRVRMASIMCARLARASRRGNVRRSDVRPAHARRAQAETGWGDVSPLIRTEQSRPPSITALPLAELLHHRAIPPLIDVSRRAGSAGEAQGDGSAEPARGRADFHAWFASGAGAAWRWKHRIATIAAGEAVRPPAALREPCRRRLAALGQVGIASRPAALIVDRDRSIEQWREMDGTAPAEQRSGLALERGAADVRSVAPDPMHG